MIATTWVEELDEDRTEQVCALLLAARDADGRPDVAPGGPLPSEFRGGRHLLATSGDELLGYAHLDTRGDAFGNQVAELIVHPARRREGVGTGLLDALLDGAAEKLRIWAHGDHPAALRLAERTGLPRVRALLLMHVPARDWPEPVAPEGVTLRAFAPGRDEEAVVDVNSRAFDWHPEQSAFSVRQLRDTELEPWFDAAGFVVAENAEGRVVGYHWTKVHPPTPGLLGGEPAGEVYLVGVDPSGHGGGLGKALTLAGLRHLRARGLPQMILYVEGDNAPAVNVYRKLGFEAIDLNVQYARGS